MLRAHRYTQVDLKERGARKWERTCPRILRFRRWIFVGCTSFRGQTERRPVRSYGRNSARSRSALRLVYNDERRAWERSQVSSSPIVPMLCVGMQPVTLCVTSRANVERERSLGCVLQSGQQQPLIQLFAQSLRLIKLHALQMLPVRIRLRRIERGLAQFQNLGDLEFSLQPVQRS